MNNSDLITLEWTGCYNDSWVGEIDPDAIAHPAKYSRGLIKRIYEFALSNDWIKPGDAIIDPFGGVGLGGFYAMYNNLNWIGVELEQRFVDLGNKNIVLWNSRYDTLPNWGSATLIQGDSRFIRDRLTQPVSLAVTSPPYAESLASDDPDKRGGLFSDPKRRSDKTLTAEYGSSPGQLGVMRSSGFDLAVTSPPFANSLESKDVKFNAIARPGRTVQCADYGKSEGQLGVMRSTDFDLAVTSPPFSPLENQPCINQGTRRELNEQGRGPNAPYGETKDNIGNLSMVESALESAAANKEGTEQETFWSASALIIEQLYDLLKPGSRAIFITKDYIRSGQRVPFSEQWSCLCQSRGFRQTHWIHAMLVEELGTQYDLFGGSVTKTVERKSFFRRLWENKGLPRIDWEDVTIFIKE